LNRRSYKHVFKAPIDEILPNAVGVPLFGEPFFVAFPLFWHAKFPAWHARQVFSCVDRGIDPGSQQKNF
jgi:hypothetical protein